MYSLLRPILFSLDAETAHDVSLSALKNTQRTPLKALYAQSVSDKPVEVMGLTFPNPLGLAAGLDKNGECIDAFAAMGFGFIEVGTVTPKPQPGNDKPRLFRLPEANAIINRMGFNNKGVDYLVEQVKKAHYKGILGINIGKNKTTPEEQALEDYLICLRKVYPYASYITVNISSPNTPGLRDLQHGDALQTLLTGLKQAQSELAEKSGRYVPIAVKIAPDLDDNEIAQMADALMASKMDGVIATNTTLDRALVEGLEHADEAGGLSGQPLTEKSDQVLHKLARHLDGKLPIIGVGGIDGPQAARQRMDSGANLLQVYSAFIYQGPSLITKILKHI
ncbi:Dihydroorotate dehydrogenase (quinone) [Saliniradius amylolyticus]|uniref:Dihydroorotate dehydrogenase (quinone) n=1 Tax=Saliniradius amylolyticus TaxID=2183582 RepID=A0A2S2E2M7_9ALTE|nr:quinone-dependent dihydroorotate dehydrogenase [Saliniradius amylolyticus]AWL11898.1 Dihydroorotate dehydrogenase (quinone) [Saliniradius amylolyticus]